MAAPVDRRIRLRYKKVLFAVSSQILDLVSHPAVHHLAIRRLDESKFIDSRESTHRTDQPDVWAFRRLNWTNASVVRRMNVAYFEAGALAAETSRSEGGQTPLVRQFCQGIRLIHELRKLRSAEEIPDDCAKRFRIDELLRCHPIDVDVEQGHPLLDQTLGAGKTDPALVCQ